MLLCFCHWLLPWASLRWFPGSNPQIWICSWWISLKCIKVPPEFNGNPSEYQAPPPKYFSDYVSDWTEYYWNRCPYLSPLYWSHVTQSNDSDAAIRFGRLIKRIPAFRVSELSDSWSMSRVIDGNYYFRRRFHRFEAYLVLVRYKSKSPPRDIK